MNHTVAVWVFGWLACGGSVITLFAGAALINRRDPQPPSQLQLGQQFMHHVRKHSRQGGYYEIPAILPHHQQILAGSMRSHWALSNGQWHDVDHPVDVPSTGRRSAHNPARTIVDSNWRPPVGATRIALLNTPTDHYMVIPITVIGDDSPTTELKMLVNHG
jgi:hypothetical protein